MTVERRARPTMISRDAYARKHTRGGWATHDDVAEEIASVFADLRRGQVAETHQEWMHVNLTLAQVKVLYLVDALGPTHLSAVAEFAGVTATGMTGIVDRLERERLVRRTVDVNDRRATIVELEPAGRDLVEAIYDSSTAGLVSILGRLSSEDLDALQQGFSAVGRALREQRRACSHTVRVAGA